jgi:hypothetical protein
MTELALYVFLVLPLVIMAIGLTGAWLHVRSLKRHHNTPAE